MRPSPTRDRPVRSERGLCKRGHDDWYDPPGGGKQRCRTCRREQRKYPVRSTPGTGAGKKRVAELKALFDAPTEEERWDKAAAWCHEVLLTYE